MTTYTKSQLSSLNEEELIQIGADEYNLELDDSMSKTALVEEIWASIKASIKASKENEKDAKESLDSTPADKKEKVKITIAKGGENDPDYVTPAINGRVWQIKRGVEVEVPKFVARHIQKLTQTVYKPVQDSSGKVIGKKAEEVARFNVQTNF
ncbi:hypothetical protein SAMN02745753_03729 [Marinomonas polaris DSM 16579]|uniref:Uncharacterized protein n=1 Tax=Marinomonas polaris DSM 16579 TaxID=1122206 RepID=A0A1M5J056_9GAMM|nr:hypothetical protein [Marinomonas polaris]SHG33998.1 hypothetical protein SAMN02745753_03729 [Marinomonas polaris DSM 16579]